VGLGGHERLSAADGCRLIRLFARPAIPGDSQEKRRYQQYPGIQNQFHSLVISDYMIRREADRSEDGTENQRCQAELSSFHVPAP